MFLPQPGDLEVKDLKSNVQKIYDIILDTFLWDKKEGHTTEVMPFEVAGVMVLRERVKNLRSLWN